MTKAKLITEIVDGNKIVEGSMCPQCDCDTVRSSDEKTLACSGCGLPIDGENQCNLDNGYNCGECDPEYCPECEDYCREQYCENKDCEECNHDD